MIQTAKHVSSDGYDKRAAENAAYFADGIDAVLMKMLTKNISLDEAMAEYERENNESV